MRTNLIAEKIRPSQACEGHRSSGGGVIRHGFDQRYGVADIGQYPWQNEVSAKNSHSGMGAIISAVVWAAWLDLAMLVIRRSITLDNTALQLPLAHHASPDLQSPVLSNARDWQT
ncbi:hypothetical protein [Mesorhizobium sp.]|uniref:hypothetical protein n=1 Tax=Mesorhizobium sp. TaxID=1871066 RepID=UPI00257F1094|nr:hypothetical protein [Mesorhizobium sp.]